jgi:hypothetical protein
VSDPDKKMCMRLNVRDLSLISMVQSEHDNIKISESLVTIWEQKTKYRGTYDIMTRSLQD